MGNRFLRIIFGLVSGGFLLSPMSIYAENPKEADKLKSKSLCAIELASPKAGVLLEAFDKAIEEVFEKAKHFKEIDFNIAEEKAQRILEYAEAAAKLGDYTLEAQVLTELKRKIPTAPQWKYVGSQLARMKRENFSHKMNQEIGRRLISNKISEKAPKGPDLISKIIEDFQKSSRSEILDADLQSFFEYCDTIATHFSKGISGDYTAKKALLNVLKNRLNELELKGDLRKSATQLSKALRVRILETEMSTAIQNSVDGRLKNGGVLLDKMSDLTQLRDANADAWWRRSLMLAEFNHRIGIGISAKYWIDHALDDIQRFVQKGKRQDELLAYAESLRQKIEPTVPRVQIPVYTALYNEALSLYDRGNYLAARASVQKAIDELYVSGSSKELLSNARSLRDRIDIAIKMQNNPPPYVQPVH